MRNARQQLRLEQIDTVDPVDFARDDDRGHIDGGDVTGDVFQTGGPWPCRLCLRRATQAVFDHLLPVLRAENLGRQNLVDRHADALARRIGACRQLPCLGRHRHGLWGRGSDKHQTGQPLRTARSDELSDLAAHRMADQDVLLDLQRLDHAPRVVGEISEAIAASGSVGFAPAAVVDRNGAVRFRQSRNDLAPGARRASPIVQEHEGEVAAALLLNVNPSAVRGDFHGDLLDLRRAGRCQVGPEGEGRSRSFDR